MSETQKASYAAEDRYRSGRPESTAWIGVVIFAGVMLMLVGTFQVIEGFVAIVRDEYYLATRNDLVAFLESL